MRKIFRATLALAAAWIPASAPAAITITDLTGSLGSFSYSVSGTNIIINETWTAATLAGGPVSLKIEGIQAFDQDGNFVRYQITKNITNNTGVSWTSLATELLDPAGDPQDVDDPFPQPAFVPVGYSTSNNTDGLSFAQGSGLLRDSDVFGTIVADELTDARDFLDYIDGTVANGTTFYIRHGLDGLNQFSDPVQDANSFLLVQRANARSIGPAIPEPGSWLTMILGFGILGAAVRMRRSSRTWSVAAPG
jgi:hypothetical protein